MNTSYQPDIIEKNAQSYWDEHQCFKASENLSKEKFYCLSMLPYPSGELHMGHVRNYTIGDTISRYQRMQGKNVLQPMGWDSFGLPAENAAIAHQVTPSEWTEKNIKKMRKQFKRLGFGYDWDREISTCEPAYYRWEQWLFLKLYERGLAYKKNALVNWDPVDNTVLANEQVIDGKGWRSGAPVERREISQWFFKITDYADALLEDLNQLEHWPETVKRMQKNWIGRSEGVEIDFMVANRAEPLCVYTTRADTLFGASTLGIAFDHPLAIQARLDDPSIDAFCQACQNVQASEATLSTQEKKGIFTGYHATCPLTGVHLPIWITNFVLMDYGTGAVLCVPAHDSRDHAFAKQYDLPITPVIAPSDKSDWDYQAQAFTEPGLLFNSKEFDGLDQNQAIAAITEALVQKQKGRPRVNYRLRDWGVSRQRYWGTPIPIIYCDHCGTVPVPEHQLPVTLPTDLIPTGQASPLTECAAFLHTKCPQCGHPAKRETDTLDTFVESSWYYARYCSSQQDQAMLDDCAKYWTPVNQYIGGVEHAVMHLLYARFMHKVLRDLDLLNSNEPFSALITQGMVLKDGQKMSKSKGNIVAPQALIKQYGADTVRLFSMFAAPIEQSLEWSDSGTDGCHRFLNKLWQCAHRNEAAIKTYNSKPHRWPDEIDESVAAIRRIIHQTLEQAQKDYTRYQFNTVVSACMIIQNQLIGLDIDLSGGLSVLHEGLSILLRLLAPITPHIAHHLWQSLGYGDNILNETLPKANQKALFSQSITMVIQINGKRRTQITVNRDMSQEDIEKYALNDHLVHKTIQDQSIRKIIFVPEKLINIVV